MAKKNEKTLVNNDEQLDAQVEAPVEAESTGEVTPEAKPSSLKKAGPKAAKAVKQAEAEGERKEKAATKAETPKAKVHTKPNPLKQHGKNYREAQKLIDPEKLYDLEEAIELAQKTSKVKFDASLELHVNLGVDPKQADQMVRAAVVLPNGTGKTSRVAVITKKADEAKKAGADLVGEQDLIEKIEKGKIDFDILITTPDMMPTLAKLAKVLGPKGLMPNPKSGTVTTDVVKAVKEAKAGKVEFRIDKQSIVHQAFGKVSFKPTDLTGNAKALISALMKAKPAAAKGTYVLAMSVSSSMGPGIRVNHTQAISTSAKK